MEIPSRIFKKEGVYALDLVGVCAITREVGKNVSGRMTPPVIRINYISGALLSFPQRSESEAKLFYKNLSEQWLKYVEFNEHPPAKKAK